MNYARVRIALKLIALSIISSALLGVGHAHASVTYFFAVDSAANGRPGGDGSDVPATDPVFQYASATIADVLVTLSDPAAGGTLDYREDFYGKTYESSGLTVNSRTAGGSHWGQLEINQVGLPDCVTAYFYRCFINASLAISDGGPSSGLFRLYGDSDELWLEASGGSWAGYIGSDDSSKFYPYAWGLTLTGHWREVPLPGTLVLLSGGVVGLGIARRRRIYRS